MNETDEKTEIVNSQSIKGILWRKKTERQDELIMNKKYCYAAVILFSLLVAGIQPTFATTWVIGPDRLDPAGLPDPVLPPPEIGTWSEGTRTFTLAGDMLPGDNIQIIDDDLTLDGAGSTVSSASGLGSGVLIEGSDFVQGKSYVTIKNLNVTGWNYGIYLDGSSNNNMENNTVSECGIGIYLKNSRDSYVQDNAVSDCITGIHLHESRGVGYSDHYNSVIDNTASGCDVGISLVDSDNNTVRDNTVTGDTYSTAGIRLSSGAVDNAIESNTISGIASFGTGSGIDAERCASNTLKDNTISESRTGIKLQVCLNFSVTTNDISNNDLGIDLYNSSNSKIYNNDFIDNDVQANVLYGSGNVFDWGGSGNYWSDYTGEDTNDDGIGDTDIPHLGLDNYPFVVGNGWSNQPPSADAGPDQTVPQDSPAGASVTLNGSGSSDDPIQPLTYTWTWDSSSASGVNPIVTLPAGTTTVTLTVSDGVLSDTDYVDITVESVEPPGDVVQEIVDYIELMDVPEDAQKEIGKAVKELNKAIDEFNKGKIDKALDKIAKAVKQLMTAQKDGADTEDVIDDLVELAEGITDEAIKDAFDEVYPDIDNHHLVKAQGHFVKALGNIEDGKYDKAIKEFKKAYTEAMKALR